MHRLPAGQPPARATTTADSSTCGHASTSADPSLRPTAVHVKLHRAVSRASSSATSASSSSASASTCPSSSTAPAASPAAAFSTGSLPCATPPLPELALERVDPPLKACGHWLQHRG